MSYFIFGILTLPIVLIFFDKEIRNLKENLKIPEQKYKLKIDYKKVSPIFVYASLKDFSISGLFLMIAIFVNNLIKDSFFGNTNYDFYTSLISSVIILFGGIGAFTGGYLDNKNSRKNILLYSCLFAGILFLFTSNNLLLIIIIFSMISFLISSNDPSLGNWLGDSMPKNLHGTSFALMYGLGQIVGSFSGTLAGVLLNYFSTTIYFKTLSVPLIIASIVIPYLYPKIKLIANLKN
jgi:MFS family permease